MIFKPFFSGGHTDILFLTQISQKYCADRNVCYIIIRFGTSLTQIRDNQVWK